MQNTYMEQTIRKLFWKANSTHTIQMDRETTKENMNIAQMEASANTDPPEAETYIEFVSRILKTNG